MTDLIFGRTRPRLAYSGIRRRTTSSTIKRWLLGVVFVLVLSPLLTTIYSITRAGESARVYAATSSTLNFQGRLLNSSGSLVNDGSYSIQFKLYDAVSAGTNEWTETETVSVKNGYFSANLGSVTPFASTIDWSQEKWLTMNVNSDGEMTPRIKLTAVPYALRAGQADTVTITGGSITGDNLLQKAPGSPQSLSSANAGLRLNQTGAGGLIQLQGDGVDVLTISKAGLISANGLNNNSAGITNAGSITGIGANLTGTAGVNLASGGSGALTLTSGSGTLVLGTGTNTIQRTNSSFLFDLNNAGLSTFNIGNSNGSNLANLDVSGGIFAGTNDALKIDSNGSLTTTFRQLDGSTTTTSGSGVNGGTVNVGSGNTTNFDVGNYVLINGTYAKITSKTASALSITPSLSWSAGAAVTEYYIPEIGGTDTGSTLTNRFGRGYFISGVATGNGTTFYNEDSIDTNLTSFDLLNTNATTINFGGAATTLNIGSSSSTINISGNLATASGKTITAAGGLVVSSGGISNNGGGITSAGTIGGVTGLTFTSGSLNLNSGGITNTGSLAGVSSITASGTISANTTNTINGLSINSGALTGVTGITFSSGNLALGGGNITGAGSIAGTSLGVTGAISAATSTNTINGLIINSGSLSGITGYGQTSGTFSVTGSGGITLGGGSNALTIDSTAFDVTSAGAVSGVTTLSLSGAISGATATNTINGLIINAGSLSGITGFSQSSGNFAISGSGTFSTGTGAISLNGATSVTGTNTFTVGTGATSLGGALTVTGLTSLNGGLTLQTGDTFTINAEGFTDLTGNGLVLSGTTLSVDVATAGTVAGTTSNSGLIVAADGVSLLRGCANNQILKWATGGGGAWSCAADNTGVSDARLKKNIESINTDVLSRIRNVNLYSFDFDCTNPAFQKMHCDTDHQTGVIAQELMQLFPELVMDVNGHYEVNYNALNLYNLKAVGELAGKVDDLAAHGVLGEVTTGNVLRLDANGMLQNITGLNIASGGASIVGGLSNNSGGIRDVGALSGVTSIGAQSISLAASQSANMLTLTKDGNNVFTVFNSGALELKLDSQNALAVKSANGDNALNVDTLTGKVKIGAGNNGKTVLFVLDTKSSDGDPPGVNGAQYYNSKLNKFRCYQHDQWQDCLQSAFSEYGLITQNQSWQQAVSEGEPPGEHRTWVDLSNGNQIRLLANITTAAPQGSSCKLQYALADTNPDWKDLVTSGQLGMDKTGALKSDWLQITDDAKAEVLIRVVCKGGTTTGSVDVNSVRMQVR